MSETGGSRTVNVLAAASFSFANSRSFLCSWVLRTRRGHLPSACRLTGLGETYSKKSMWNIWSDRAGRTREQPKTGDVHRSPHQYLFQAAPGIHCVFHGSRGREMLSKQCLFLRQGKQRNGTRVGLGCRGTCSANVPWGLAHLPVGTTCNSWPTFALSERQNTSSHKIRRRHHWEDLRRWIALDHTVGDSVERVCAEPRRALLFYHARGYHFARPFESKSRVSSANGRGFASHL